LNELKTADVNQSLIRDSMYGDWTLAAIGQLWEARGRLGSR
jgi:hypothetical protein